MQEPTPTDAVWVPISKRPVHPNHGIHSPRQSAPERRRGSVRRTSTIDSVRPGDMMGDFHQTGRARDLRTHADGSWEILKEASVFAIVDMSNFFSLTELHTDPHREELAALIGRSVSTGFRAATVALIPDERDRATLLNLLLDDLPGAALVSGYAIGASGVKFERKEGSPILQIPDLCAGFQRGGTMMTEIDATGRPPTVTGPRAPSLIRHEDPVAWHQLLPLPARGMRRWRCLDVWLEGPDIKAEAYFRDSHMDEDLVETVVHEYTVQVSIDPITRTVQTSDTTAHSLPWVECIQAQNSGSRISGMALLSLRPVVREEFVGTSTCTHLNDTLRSIEDVRALIEFL